MRLPQSVEIVEVGLRDGLQSEAQMIPVDVKLQYIDWLIDAGVKRIQVTAFVNPQRVPQMADADELCSRLPQNAEVEFSGLVLNTKGLERLHQARLRAVDLGVSASDTHSIKNTGQAVAEKLVEAHQMIGRARELGLKVRAGVQCAFGCVYEGAIPQQKVVEIARQYLDAGIDELALADSTGMANPLQIKRMLEAVLPLAGDVPVVLHLHDTRGLGLANVMAALEIGVRQFDTAFGGLGGCPFIAGAAGNIATEDTLYLLESLEIATGVDRVRVARVAQDLVARLGRELSGKLYKLN
jgi:hydroxymethylglutaryl-CoA lyase